MSDVAISVNNVSKIYKLYDKPADRLKEALGFTRQKKHKDHFALNNVSFDVKRGETVGIIGTNGSGKSTLINSLFGENKTEEGLISKKNQRGKNTTTSVTLYKVGNGYIADTPGFSTFSVEEIESKELSKYYEINENVKVNITNNNSHEMLLKLENKKVNFTFLLEFYFLTFQYKNLSHHYMKTDVL